MIQRYTVGNKPFSIDEDPEGDFVFYSDHEAIVKELVEALEKYVEHFGDPLKCAHTAIAKAKEVS